MLPAIELAHVLDAHWPQVEHSDAINSWQLRTLSAIRRCRTAALGSHVDGCTNCGHLRISYNSCRNRHCPKCQGIQRELWIQKREAELLPVPYFHLVFGKDVKWLGAQTGMIAILPTWGQTMSLHPHLHCIVPGGGLTKQHTWRTAKSEGKYLFNVKAMSSVFRGKFIEQLKKTIARVYNHCIVKQSLQTAMGSICKKTI